VNHRKVKKFILYKKVIFFFYVHEDPPFYSAPSPNVAHTCLIAHQSVRWSHLLSHSVW